MTGNSIPNPLDFSGKTVLVVGGSSGIGNGIAQAFCKHGAQVHVWGTRASAADYQADEGSDLNGLVYARVDVGDEGVPRVAQCGDGRHAGDDDSLHDV